MPGSGYEQQARYSRQNSHAKLMLSDGLMDSVLVLGKGTVDQCFDLGGSHGADEIYWYNTQTPSGHCSLVTKHGHRLGHYPRQHRLLRPLMRYTAEEYATRNIQILSGGEVVQHVRWADTDTGELCVIETDEDGKFVHDGQWNLKTKVYKPEGGFSVVERDDKQW